MLAQASRGPYDLLSQLERSAQPAVSPLSYLLHPPKQLDVIVHDALTLFLVWLHRPHAPCDVPPRTMPSVRGIM